MFRLTLGVALVVIAFWAGWIARIVWTPPAPTEWTTVRVFSDELSKNYPVVVQVAYSRSYSTGSPSTKTFLQNKIQVDAEGNRHEFRWPDNETYAAACADIVDLDQDGRKEIVLTSGGSARVVSFVNGRFIFREKEDELFVPIGNIAIVEGHGERYFVAVISGENVSLTSTKRLATWSFDSGFSTIIDNSR